MGPALGRPARTLSQNVATSQPAGVFTPTPVTATRGRPRWSVALMFGISSSLISRSAEKAEVSHERTSSVGAQLAEHEGEGGADRLDPLQVLFRYGNVEALLEGHDELDQVETVGVEVLLEAGLLGDGRRVDGEHLHRRLLEDGERLRAVHVCSPLPVMNVPVMKVSVDEVGQCPMDRPPSTARMAPVM